MDLRSINDDGVTVEQFIDGDLFQTPANLMNSRN